MYDVELNTNSIYDPRANRSIKWKQNAALPKSKKIIARTVAAILFLLPVFFVYSGTALASSSISIDPNNPHYFDGLDGQPILFLSHASNSIVDGGLTDQNWKWYIDRAVANGINLAKLNININDDTEDPNTNRITAFNRVYGRGTTNFGHNKWDTDQLNDAYFTMLGRICRYAQSKGMYIQVQVWNHIGLKHKRGLWVGWNGNAFNPKNTIVKTAAYGFSGSKSGDGYRVFYNSLNNKVTVGGETLLQRQDDLFDRIVDATKSYNNVFYELGNEVSPGTAWARHWTSRLHSIAPAKLMIVDTGHYNGSISTFDGVTKHQVSINDDSVPESLYDTGKMGIEDTDFTDDWAGSDYKKAREAGWRAVVSGVGWTDFRIWSNVFVNVGSSYIDWKYPRVVQQISYIRKFFDSRNIPFADMTPHDSTATTGSNIEVLAGDGKYVVYSDSNNFTLNLAPGNYKGEWYNPRSGKFSSAGSINGGSQKFFLPSYDDWVLYLTASTSTGTSFTSTDLIKDMAVQDAGNAADWSLRDNIQSGSRQYGDRTYAFTSIPKSLTGSDWIRTANDSKRYTGTTLATFKVKTDSNVYVAFNDSITPPSWLSAVGWTDTGMNITNNESKPKVFSLFKKSFTAGSTVFLGNNSNTRQGLYTIILKPADSNGTGTSSTPTDLVQDIAVRDAGNAADWSLSSDIKSGKRQYGDRNYSFTSVPASLAGSDWIRTANDSKRYTGTTLATFKVKADANVYVAFNDLIPAPSWLSASGWTDTGMDIVNNESRPKIFSLFKKSFTAGTTVVLGHNGNTRQGLYTVVLKRKNSN